MSFVCHIFEGVFSCFNNPMNHITEIFADQNNEQCIDNVMRVWYNEMKSNERVRECWYEILADSCRDCGNCFMYCTREGVIQTDQNGGEDQKMLQKNGIYPDFGGFTVFSQRKPTDFLPNREGEHRIPCQAPWKYA